jgi:hypothetical protein
MEPHDETFTVCVIVVGLSWLRDRHVPELDVLVEEVESCEHGIPLCTEGARISTTGSIGSLPEDSGC